MKFLKKLFKKTVVKIISIALLSVILLFVLVVGGLNILKFAIYSDYYAIEDTVCDNPGLGDGFVCQGICVSEEKERILVSGYMKNGEASRIYVTDYDSNAHYVSLSFDGEPFTGHVGGIATKGNNVYIANDGKIHIAFLTEIVNAENGAVIDVSTCFPVNNQASFVYADENYLYVGEFNDGKNYITEHPYTTAEGEHKAIVSRYAYNSLNKPDKIYSIRDKVQGICFTPDGKVVMSTSYGLADSVYYVYDESEATNSGLTLDGAPVYYLEKCEKEIKGPAMSEDLDYFDGKVITLTESASDKYIFGKFFFANDIVTLDFSDKD